MPITIGNPLIPEITQTLEYKRNNNKTFEIQKCRSQTCSAILTPRDKNDSSFIQICQNHPMG